MNFNHIKRLEQNLIFNCGEGFIANIMSFSRTDTCKVRKEIRIMQTVKAGESNSEERLKSFKFCFKEGPKYS